MMSHAILGTLLAAAASVTPATPADTVAAHSAAVRQAQAPDLDALATQKEAEADRLMALAVQRKLNPTWVDQKHPNAPGTFGHTLWLAKKARAEASAARELSKKSKPSGESIEAGQD